MASILDFSAGSSDEDDVDFIPNANGANSDSSLDEEDSDGDDSPVQFHLDKSKSTKRGQQTNDDEKESKADSPVKTVDEKKRAKELWDSFLSDVDPPVTSKTSTPAIVIPCKSETKAPEIAESKPVSKIFEFAGETISVDDSVSSDSSPAEKNSEQETVSPCISKKRGINSVLGTIMNKNKKLTVLEKSLMDWNSFKKDEGLDNELETFNKGKKGFVERKRFLERSDLRSFEIEKSMRQTLRKK